MKINKSRLQEMVQEEAEKLLNEVKPKPVGGSLDSFQHTGTTPEGGSHTKEIRTMYGAGPSDTDDIDIESTLQDVSSQGKKEGKPFSSEDTRQHIRSLTHGVSEPRIQTQPSIRQVHTTKYDKSGKKISSDTETQHFRGRPDAKLEFEKGAPLDPKKMEFEKGYKSLSGTARVAENITYYKQIIQEEIQSIVQEGTNGFGDPGAGPEIRFPPPGDTNGFGGRRARHTKGLNLAWTQPADAQGFGTEEQTIDPQTGAVAGQSRHATADEIAQRYNQGGRFRHGRRVQDSARDRAAYWGAQEGSIGYQTPNVPTGDELRQTPMMSFAPEVTTDPFAPEDRTGVGHTPLRPETAKEASEGIPRTEAEHQHQRTTGRWDIQEGLKINIQRIIQEETQKILQEQFGGVDKYNEFPIKLKPEEIVTLQGVDRPDEDMRTLFRLAMNGDPESQDLLQLISPSKFGPPGMPFDVIPVKQPPPGGWPQN